MPSQLHRLVNDYLFSPVGIVLMFWLTSWVLFLVFGKALVEWLKKRKGMKWAPREDTPDSHLQKAGTPSMGGIGIIGAAFVSWVGVFFFVICLAVWGHGTAPTVKDLHMFTFPALVVLHAVLGYIDDHSKATNRGGLSSKAKLLGQILLAAGFLLILYWSRAQVSTGMGQILDPAFSKSLFSSWLMVLGALLVIIGTSNAVNLTDGIDGLVGGLCVQVALIFAALLFLSFSHRTSEIEQVAFLFWLSLGGACLGFLSLNKYPAKVFMGDTGSLALGAALGAGAIVTRTVWLLPFIGFIFFVEMFSVIFQVAYFKYTKKKTGEGKRLFRRAPLHHHFELGGWSEWRVVATFWAINLCTSILGLVLWNRGILPRFP